MKLHFRTRNDPLFSFLHPLNLTSFRSQKLSKTLTMAAEPSARRATCPSCSKPAPLCLCVKIKNPNLNNSIAVTILQHSLEQKHLLNSAKIAALGFENVNVVLVSDVNLEARFEIWPIECNSEIDFGCFKEMNDGLNEKSSTERHDIDFLIGKYGVISSDFNPLFDSPKVLNALAKGFVVKKWNNKLVNGSTKHEEFQEFELEVRSGSTLLFPSEKSVGIEAINFKVKNLIVLDGTWAKAKRIYNENPWLKVLPHLKLDVDKMSLYSEVRHQPKAGYLSTIESIVYAMKGLGDETDGLDHLLEVFESMIGDQRRCKYERLNKVSI